ncbi:MULTISPECIES: DMT family transporter [unclassified Rhodococcus (in: high G+C Gram-positive bacteria)]|uniref:DMT family transporter n=1 Tax=unclassified Rhodococcus (in: high G+C Gram-positive bacteria) TaxID=192944 RepID=UPI00146B4501|nr:DMT family transporter [Rhodococcus sp. BL-253-APC-6A1W]NMD96945.1 DMT family transporter [Rhodococcus sp. BL-253-APC-6A1W]
MRHKSSAIVPSRLALSSPEHGLRWGLLGVVAFSFTLPMTRFVVEKGAMTPLFVGAGRAVVAGLLAAIALLLTRQVRPRGSQWIRLTAVAGGVVIGFPFLTSYALTTVPASHGAVVVAILPAATAVAAVLRGRERPPAAFWATAGIGTVAALVFASLQTGGFAGLEGADVLLFGAVIAAAVGYAEGGLLSRELGAWQTISWALVLSTPFTVALTGLSMADRMPTGTLPEWGAFAYLGIVSMFLGFFAWYRGLAIGPMAQVSQIQLTQPVMTICWAALILHEHLTWPVVGGGLVVILCAATAVRTRATTTSRSRPEESSRRDVENPSPAPSP